MAEVLDHIHRNNWVHGDIHPRNFLLDADSDAVWLIDFESSFQDIQSENTQRPQQVWGNSEYYSPEIDEHGAIAMSKKSDIWAFGLLLLEWLAPPVFAKLRSRKGWRNILEERSSENHNDSFGSIIDDDSPQGLEEIWNWVRDACSIDRSRRRPIDLSIFGGILDDSR